jgi:A/G-specific adenine glycosylase
MTDINSFDSGNFRKKLLEWFRINRRDLPWRCADTHETNTQSARLFGGKNYIETSIKKYRDPYSVVVSEVMLQQTQVKTVLRYYENWMKLFPTFEALAKAPIEKVLKAWEGLGYYTRARNLKRIAELVVENYSGELPASIDELQKLPGVGPYSARSIASLAYNTPAACVDGNVVRVLARLNNIDKTYKSGSLAQKDFQPFADSVAGVDIQKKSNSKTRREFDFGEWNEAMMEFGATVCTKGNPQCLLCPVRELCEAYKKGTQNEIPHFEAKKMEAKRVNRAWIYNKNKFLICNGKAATGKLHGLWELPLMETLELKKETQKEIFRRTRNITKYKIIEVIYGIPLSKNLLKIISKNKSLRWTEREELETLPFSGPHAQWIKELLEKKTQESF